MSLLNQYPFISKLKRNRKNGYERLKFSNGFEVSIQANEYAYCSPRENNLEPTQYDSFEVAVYDSKGKYVRDDKLGGLSEILPRGCEPDRYSFISRMQVQIIVDYVSRMSADPSSQNCDASDESYWESHNFDSEGSCSNRPKMSVEEAVDGFMESKDKVDEIVRDFEMLTGIKIIN